MATKEIELKVTVVVSADTDPDLVAYRVAVALDDYFAFGVKEVTVAGA